MSSAPLRAIRDALLGVSVEDRPGNLLELLAADIAAAESGWPMCIVAADNLFVERLQRALPDAMALRPFDEVVEWDEDDKRTLERSGVLVAGTSARQLLPRPLVQSIQVAALAGAPVVLLVESIGRTRDPAKSVAGIPRQLASAIPHVRVSWVCLGDSRYEGPTVCEAAASALPLRSPAQRACGLAAFRAQAAAAALEGRMNMVQRLISAASESGSLLRATEHGGTILASAETAGWRQHLRGMRDALAAIDVDDVVNAARGEASRGAIPRRAFSLLRDRAGKGLAKAAKDAEPLFLADLDRFVTALTRDLMRARDALDALGAPVELTPPDFTTLRSSIRSQIEWISTQILASMVIPDRILALAELAGRIECGEDKETAPPGDDAIPPYPDDAGDSAPEVATEEKAGDRSPQDSEDQGIPQSEEGGLASRIRGLLANAPERVLVARLGAALNEALGEAQVRYEHTINTACTAWAHRLAEVVEGAYAPLHVASEQARQAVGCRLDGLVGALHAVEEVYAPR